MGAPAAHGKGSPLQRMRARAAPRATPSWPLQTPPPNPRSSKQSDSKEAGRTRGESQHHALTRKQHALKGHPGRKGHVFTQTQAGGAEPRNWHGREGWTQAPSTPPSPAAD